MKILLWAPIFFGYDKQIKDALVSMGHTVYLVHDRPFNSTFLRAVTTRLPNFMSKILTLYYKSKLKIIPKNVDFVLVINGQTLSPEVLDLITSNNINATKCLYLWDSLDNRSNVQRIMDKFDKVFSFDVNDCRKFELFYRPLFYAPTFSSLPKGKSDLEGCRKLVVGFIGTIHSDRLKVISKFSKVNSGFFLKKYLYLHHPWVYAVSYFRERFFRNYSLTDFKYSALSLVECAEFFNNCDAILDIEHIDQSGLTMRTLESIGMNKRLITTNKSVIEHEFYSADCIYVIERDSSFVSDTFLKGEFSGYSDEIRYKYSLNGWLDDVLGMNS